MMLKPPGGGWGGAGGAGAAAAAAAAAIAAAAAAAAAATAASAAGGCWGGLCGRGLCSGVEQGDPSCEPDSDRRCRCWAVVRGNGVQRERGWEESRVEGRLPLRRVVIECEGMMRPAEGGRAFFPSAGGAEGRRVGVACGFEEGLVCSGVWWDFNLLGFAEGDERCCGKAGVGHDF